MAGSDEIKYPSHSVVAMFGRNPSKAEARNFNAIMGSFIYVMKMLT